MYVELILSHMRMVTQTQANHMRIYYFLFSFPIFSSQNEEAVVLPNLQSGGTHRKRNAKLTSRKSKHGKDSFEE